MCKSEIKETKSEFLWKWLFRLLILAILVIVILIFVKLNKLVQLWEQIKDKLN